jgi:hypothetical protein
MVLHYFTELPFTEEGHSRALSQPPNPYRLVLLSYPKEVDDMLGVKLEIMLRIYRQLVVEDNSAQIETATLARL